MKFSQAPSSVVMVRPASFGSNPQTALTNAFQDITSTPYENIKTKAMEEFDSMVDKMRAYDMDVLVVEDTVSPAKPDAVFPNNWISFHEDGTVVLYPMMAENRRLERSLPVLAVVKSKFEVNSIFDFSDYEQTSQFLEGTGSIVFDYQNRIAYACRSGRTNDVIFNEICTKLNFKPVIFDAVDEQGLPIYHTNVLMCIGTHFTVICLDAIKNDADQETILNLMADTNHKVVSISYHQLRSFAGNMIEVKTQMGEPVVLLSEQAFNSLLPGQIDAISKQADLLPLSINTIEQVGGGSVRCMVAGIFNKKI